MCISGAYVLTDPHELQLSPRSRGRDDGHGGDPVEDVSGDLVLLDGGEEGDPLPLRRPAEAVRGQVRVVQRDRQLAQVRLAQVRRGGGGGEEGEQEPPRHPEELRRGAARAQRLRAVGHEELGGLVESLTLGVK